MANSCAAAYHTCFASETTVFSTLWRWPDESQVWLRNTQQGQVRLTFTRGKAPEVEGLYDVYE